MLGLAMRLQLRSSDVATLSKRVQVLLAYMERRFPGLWEDREVRRVTVRDIKYFCEKNSIKIIYADMLAHNGDAFMCRIPLQAGGVQVAIVINEKVQQLPLASSERATKAILLHEICHFLNEHPGAVAYRDGVVDVALKESFDKYKEVEAGQNAEAELAAAILAFWPNREFERQLRLTKADFRQMANFYKMPVDCILKWTVLQFGDMLAMHYFKWDIDKREIEDSFHESMRWIFDKEDTAARKAIETRQDANSNDAQRDCFCRAYYENKEHHFNKISNRVLVVGIGRQQLSQFANE